jgi:hypothetical protein
MRPIAIVLLVATVFLSACAGPNHTQPNGEPLVITRQVEAHLQSYFRMLGGGRVGAFAVSETGTIGFYAFCSTGQCRGQYSFTNEALQHCAGFGHGPCVILAVNREIRRPYRTIGDEQAFLAQ